MRVQPGLIKSKSMHKGIKPMFELRNRTLCANTMKVEKSLLIMETDQKLMKDTAT